MSDTATEPETRPATGVVPQPGPLGRLARVTYRRRGRTVLAWVAALALAIGLSAAFAGSFSADYSAPGSDSRLAQDLLSQRFPAQSGDTVSVVVHSTGAVTSPATKARVESLLGRLGEQAHVASTSVPYTLPGAI